MTWMELTPYDQDVMTLLHRTLSSYVNAFDSPQEGVERTLGLLASLTASLIKTAPTEPLRDQLVEGFAFALRAQTKMDGQHTPPSDYAN